MTCIVGIEYNRTYLALFRGKVRPFLRNHLQELVIGDVRVLLLCLSADFVLKDQVCRRGTSGGIFVLDFLFFGAPLLFTSGLVVLVVFPLLRVLLLHGSIWLMLASINQTCPATLEGCWKVLAVDARKPIRKVFSSMRRVAHGDSGASESIADLYQG